MEATKKETEVKRKYEKKNKRYWSNLKYRKQLSVTMKIKRQDLKFNKLQSEAMKVLWEDPEHKKKMAGILAKNRKKGTETRRKNIKQRIKQLEQQQELLEEVGIYLPKRNQIRKSQIIRMLVKFINENPIEFKEIKKRRQKQQETREKNTPFLDNLILKNKTHFTSLTQNLMQNPFINIKHREMAVELELVSIADKWIQEQPEEDREDTKITFQKDLRLFITEKRNIFDYVVKVIRGV